MSQTHLRLDALLTRDVAVQWFEGVALVQAVCRALLSTTADPDRFPTASQILVGADGSVTFVESSAPKPVQAAAHLLTAMLSDDVPVRLRLLVIQATGPDSPYGSVRKFSEALEYFERPDPEAIVKELHARATAAAPRVGSQAPSTDVPVEPTAAAPPPARSMAKPLNRWALAGVAGAAVLCVSMWVVAARSDDGRLATVLERFDGLLAPSTDSVERGSAVPVATSNDRTEHRPSRAAKSRSGPPGPSAMSASSANLESLPMPRPPTAVESLIPRRLPPSSHVELSFSRGSQVTAVSEATLHSDDRVYSTADAFVTPPRQVYPALPAQPAAGKSTEGLTFLDLTVSATGHVERVRLRVPPKDVHEFMLVSAAKAWRFKPAMFKGRPVRFLHSVPITTD